MEPSLSFQGDDCSRFGLFFGDSGDPQEPADVAIVMPTVLRPVLLRAIESIYAQDFTGRIQLLIGIDKPLGLLDPVISLVSQRPERISIVVLAMPWSTSMRHGGVHPAMDGGSLRAILSFMANSRAVTYFDDDNEMMPDHIRLLFAALKGKAWAYSKRMLVDERTNEDLAVDRWDSVGPGKGRMAQQGGFVDTNCLMLDKVVCARALGRWSEGPGVASDRKLFEAIHNARHGRVDKPTIRYYIRPNSIFHHFIKTNAVF